MTLTPTAPADPSLPAAAPAESVPDAAPRSRWPWPLQALAPVVGLAVSLAAAVGVAALARLLGLREESSTGAGVVAMVLASLTVTVVATGLVVLFARLDGRRRLVDVLGRCAPRRHLVALMAGVGVSLLVVIGVGMAVTAAGLARPVTADPVGLPLAAALAVGLSQAFLLQGVPEELLFRGYLLRSLRMRPWGAVLVSSIAFGMIHLASNGGQQGWGERLLYLAMPTGFALAAGALVLLTGSVAAGVGVHGGLHLALLVSGLLAPTVPALRFGDGPALWAATGLVFALVAVVVMSRLAPPVPRRAADEPFPV